MYIKEQNEVKTQLAPVYIRLSDACIITEHLRDMSCSALGSASLLFEWAPWVKRPRIQADHSTPSSANLKNGWSYNSTPTVCLYGVSWDFTFYLSKYLIEVSMGFVLVINKMAPAKEKDVR
jgi:hypothetical protein